jgi:hypothetical protein
MMVMLILIKEVNPKVNLYAQKEPNTRNYMTINFGGVKFCDDEWTEHTKPKR